MPLPHLWDAWLFTCSNSQVVLEVLDLSVFSTCEIEMSAQITSKFKSLPYLSCLEWWVQQHLSHEMLLLFCLFSCQDGLAGGRSQGLKLGFSLEIGQGEASCLHVLQPSCFFCGSPLFCRLTFPHQWNLAGPPNFLTLCQDVWCCRQGVCSCSIWRQGQKSHRFP